MTEAQDAIARLRTIAAMPSYGSMIVGQDDARAILAHIDALTIELDEQCRLLGAGGEREARLMAERDAAVAALAQRDAEIVAWLRDEAEVYCHDDSDAHGTLQRAAAAIERGEHMEVSDA